MSGVKQDPLVLKKQLRDSMEGAQKLYNSNLMALMKIAKSKCPEDDNVAKIQETLSSVLALDKTLVIIESGPYIWKYRESISKRDVKFFLDNDFKSDVDTVLHGKKKQEFSGDEISQLMKSLKSTFKSMTKPEQEVVWTHTSNLLTAYAQYLGAEKKLKAVELQLKAL